MKLQSIGNLLFVCDTKHTQLAPRLYHKAEQLQYCEGALAGKEMMLKGELLVDGIMQSAEGGPEGFYLNTANSRTSPGKRCFV